MFKNESVPYLLTLLFAALGWTLTHFVTQVANSPLIEFRKTVANNSKTISYVVQNISKNTNFQNLSFYILLDSNKKGRCVGKPELELYPPLHLGSNRVEPECRKGLEVVFEISEFQPNSKILLRVMADNETEGVLRPAIPGQSRLTA